MHTDWHNHIHVCMLLRDEKEGRSKQGQTNNKAKQHSTPKAVTFPKKNELSRVGLEPTTLHTPDGDWHIYVHVYTLCIAHCHSEAKHGDLSFIIFCSHTCIYTTSESMGSTYIARRLHHTVHVM